MIKKKCKECGTLIDLYAQDYCNVCHGNRGWWYTCDKHQDVIFPNEVKECRVCKAEAHSVVESSDVPPAKTKKTTPLTPSSREKSTKILPWAAGLVLATLGIYWLGQNHQDQAEPAVTQNDPTSEPAPEPTPEPTPKPTLSSIFNLALDHYNKSQYADAFGYFRDASEQGHAESQVFLAFMYDKGKGVTKDDVEAVRWYRKAAEQGNAGGQVNLGVMYATGEGVPKDEVEAVKWYRKSAELDHATAQYSLALMYDTGRGVPENDAEAVKWYRKAADQDYALAQNNLALMYDNGRGVPENDAEAVKWYRKAAEQGSALAQSNLGAMYYNGHGVSEDKIQAYKWTNLAAAQGNEIAKKNKEIYSDNMIRSEIEEAQKLSSQFKPRKNTP